MTEEENKTYYQIWYGDFFETSVKTQEEINDVYEQLKSKHDNELHKFVPNLFEVIESKKVNFEYVPKPKEWVDGKVYVTTEENVYSDCIESLEDQFKRHELAEFLKLDFFHRKKGLKFPVGEKFRKIEEDNGNKTMGEKKFLHIATGIPITFMLEGPEDEAYFKEEE